MAHRDRERRLPTRNRRPAEGTAHRTCEALHRPRRAHRIRKPLSSRTLRRHAPARRDRAHARFRAEDPADGRAVRRARRTDAAAARRQGAADSGSAQADLPADHPQHHRGRAASRPRTGDDLPAGQTEAHGADRPAAPALIRDRVERRLRPLRRADLGRPARGSKPGHARRRDHAAESQIMTARAQSNLVPLALGFGSLIAAILVFEVLIRVGLINRFIVPMPSQIAGAFHRVITEEEIPHRFLVTAREALWATLLLALFGIGIGVLLYRVKLLRDATETWVAAMASAPTVLMYPLFLVIFGRSERTIIMMGFVAGLPAVILKTIEGLASTREVLVNVGRSFKLSEMQLFWKIYFPAAMPTIFVGMRLGMIFALINIVGVEFLINFGGLGQLINDLAERYDLPGTYAAICFVILVSVIFFFLTDRLERWLRPAA